MQFAIAFIGDESGGTAAEYALILALIASAIVTSLAVVGGAVSGSLSHSTTTMFH
jgi:Flp pilus assembly pilin Flp